MNGRRQMVREFNIFVLFAGGDMPGALKEI
jgi:hypothetical protein